MSKWSSEYRDVRWQKKRLEIMERDEFMCQCCGKKEDVTLNVHHAYYEKGLKPWEYEGNLLTTLCEDCHTLKHEYQKKILSNMLEMTTGKMIEVEFFTSHFQHTMGVVFNAIMGCGIDPHSIESMIHVLVEVYESNTAESEVKE